MPRPRHVEADQLALDGLAPKAAGRMFASQQSLDSYIWSICDILRRSNCAGALQYVPELTWLLFLRILDEREDLEAESAEAVGQPFTPSLREPYRWRDWAAPDGAKRQALRQGAMGSFFHFVHTELLPYLRGLGRQPVATPRQKVISQIMSGVERVRVDTEKNFQDVLDKVDAIRLGGIDDTHIFALSQVYEGLLLKMGEKGNDGGQFFTPREIIRAMVEVVDPSIGETVYDPACGTGGFLAQSFEHMHRALSDDATAEQLQMLKQRTFYGREKENLIYPIALANLVLHGIDYPRIWHGNTLTGGEIYGGLFEDAPGQFDVILTNPPFGGKEGKEAQANFSYKTGATQMLFLQHLLKNLRPGGRCGIVLDEGVLFRTNETAFVQIKRKLLDDNNLWCIVSLPAGVFSAAGAGVKANILFFERGERTKRIWYYDLSDLKVGKKNPFTRTRMREFFTLYKARSDSAHSWTIDLDGRKAQARKDAAPHEARERELNHAAEELLIQAKQKKQQIAQEPDLKHMNALIADMQQLNADAQHKQREARDARDKAQAIYAAVYDLKAVNPNAPDTSDRRTPAELLAIIDAEGRAVEEALASLWELFGIVREA